MQANEIRSRFLRYFEKHGHTVVESSSLVPANDPSLLFTNAGMVQFKDVFLGKEKRPYTRATTTQKCVRAGGKHNDLENVGFTARHHTFFEMLGNFSFGDYFKKDAIHFAWEFVTKELKLPKDKLYVTVFRDDNEAAELWHKQEAVPLERIFRLGEKDNFWAMGETGPCGPCSEIYIDRGEAYGCGQPSCTVGCDCDRYTEFWNLVFMQFERDAAGNLAPLPRPSVDTGAGLERLAMILQDTATNYDTDVFQTIIQKTAALAGVPYEKDSAEAVSFRVVADHARASTFLVGDGVLPANEGRGYVLRRIIRRAVRHGKKLGFDKPFLFKVCGFVIDQMQSAYPDLTDKRAFIEKAVLAEEELFFRTLERGLALLDDEMLKLGKNAQLPGEVAFKLYDTFGFPLDLTRVILGEKGLGVDESGFDEAMARQRSKSRENWKGSGEEARDAAYLHLADELRARSKLPQFVGYEHDMAMGECVGLFMRTDKGLLPVDLYTVQGAEAPTIEAVFAKTPFYGESGGQVGDRGVITSAPNERGDVFSGEVIDVQKPVPDLIVAHIKPARGTIRIGGLYHQETDRQARALSARNHTATHILHWALREVLGTHVKQAGSLVTPELLRFDFTHFAPVTKEELTRLEDMVNERIWRAAPVHKREMAKEEAIAAGAIAFFGEKYGDRVRVVSVGDFSTELCGGTHVDHSSDIHLFKIGSESGIAAGVRRIVAFTSKGAFDYLRAKDEETRVVRDRLKASSADEVLSKIDKLFSAEKDLKRQIDKLQAQNTAGEVDELLAAARRAGGATQVVSLVPPSAQGVGKLREMADTLKQKAPDAVVVLAMASEEAGKAFILAAVGPKAPAALKANELIGELAPLIDGRGGGKPEMAQAGGTNLGGVEGAIAKARTLLAQRLG